MRQRVIVAVAVLLATGTIALRTRAKDSPDQGLAEARAAIESGNAEWSEAWRRGDADRVAALFAQDGVQLMSSGKVRKGLAQIAEGQRSLMVQMDPEPKVVATTTHVWRDGDVAYETGRYRYDFTQKGVADSLQGRYVTMWRRQGNGTWRLVMDMGVPAP